jgi:hypothetical protein
MQLLTTSVPPFDSAPQDLNSPDGYSLPNGVLKSTDQIYNPRNLANRLERAGLVGVEAIPWARTPIGQFYFAEAPDGPVLIADMLALVHRSEMCGPSLRDRDRHQVSTLSPKRCDLQTDIDA